MVSKFCAIVVPLGILLRLLLLAAKQLYRSTDFEVHRNWLAITHQLPISEWYFEETSPWTLDYPPAFAYFEWLLSQVAVLLDPAMLQVQNLDYASEATVMFQRGSVILADVLLALCAFNLGGANAVALVLWNSALLLVDHVHFQYNGMLLGILLLSISCMETGRTYIGALLFCLLLCMKHIFLYVSPVFFVYLLRFHCGLTFQPLRLQIGALLRLGLVVLGTFLALLFPLLISGPVEIQLPQLLRRLFPFGRGLTHAYWAPNLWALYNTLDRVLAKVMGASTSGGSTSGFAEVYESAVLWTVPPKATFGLTLLAYGPLLWKIWQAPDRQGLALYVALGSAIAFTFGWHVHEKAILMVTIPLLAALPAKDRGELPDLRDAAVQLSTVATFSVMPLLPLKQPETVLKWALFVFGLVMEHHLLRPSSRFGWLLLALAGLGVYRDAGGHELLFRGMEFLPLLLTSDFCAVLVLWYFWSIFRLLPEKSGKQE